MEEPEAMPAPIGKTDPLQLRSVRNWADRQAWQGLLGRYEPLLRACCRHHGLDGEAADEVCQQTWIEVAGRIRSFEYDPRGSFRTWLVRLCRWKMLDYWKALKASSVVSIDADDRPLRDTSDHRRGRRRERRIALQGGPAEGDADPRLTLWGSLAEGIQAEVKRKVDRQTWEAFWLKEIMLWSAEETAAALGMTTSAVYAAVGRVRRRLREAGRRAMESSPGEADARG
jgi:RNA polymerase sigma factor (sigma-70 family)